jgi:SHS2 domain-containing protein
MGSHELVDHTADIALHAEASALPELFAEAAAGLFEIICDVRGTGGSYATSVRVEADSPGHLMHDWLSELLYIHETEDVVLSRFDVKIRENSLEAQVAGEKIDPERHVLKAEVKAVTYHMLSVREENGRWHATVLFDL